MFPLSNPRFQAAVRAGALPLALLITSCGGGGDSQSNPSPVAAQTPTPSPTKPPVGDATRGKALYAMHCASCHTASPRANVHNILLAANNPQAITDAINSARSGMRSLDTALSAQDRADVAAYLANPS